MVFSRMIFTSFNLAIWLLVWISYSIRWEYIWLIRILSSSSTLSLSSRNLYFISKEYTWYNALLIMTQILSFQFPFALLPPITTLIASCYHCSYIICLMYAYFDYCCASLKSHSQLDVIYAIYHHLHLCISVFLTVNLWVIIYSWFGRGPSEQPLFGWWGHHVRLKNEAHSGSMDISV